MVQTCGKARRRAEQGRWPVPVGDASPRAAAFRVAACGGHGATAPKAGVVSASHAFDHALMCAPARAARSAPFLRTSPHFAPFRSFPPRLAMAVTALMGQKAFVFPGGFWYYEFHGQFSLSRPGSTAGLSASAAQVSALNSKASAGSRGLCGARVEHRHGRVCCGCKTAVLKNPTAL